MGFFNAIGGVLFQLFNQLPIRNLGFGSNGDGEGVGTKNGGAISICGGERIRVFANA